LWIEARAAVAAPQERIGGPCAECEYDRNNQGGRAAAVGSEESDTPLRLKVSCII
jgi:hypothetical protein